MPQDKSPTFKLSIRSFQDLSLTDLYAILRLRHAVFSLERNHQQINLFRDGDLRSVYLLYHNDTGLLVGCQCITPKHGTTYEFEIRAICTHKSYRNQSLGHKLLCEAIQYIRNTYPNPTITLESYYQPELVSWYQRHGFKQDGPVYTDKNGQQCMPMRATPTRL